MCMVRRCSRWLDELISFCTGFLISICNPGISGRRGSCSDRLEFRFMILSSTIATASLLEIEVWTCIFLLGNSVTQNQACTGNRIPDGWGFWTSEINDMPLGAMVRDAVLWTIAPYFAWNAMWDVISFTLRVNSLPGSSQESRNAKEGNRGGAKGMQRGVVNTNNAFQRPFY